MANSYKRFVEELTATVAATVLTVPAATTAIVKSIWVANNASSSSNLTVTFSTGGIGNALFGSVRCSRGQTIC
jgi:hypothetical protein